MKTTGCELQDRIVAALSSAGISDNVRQHLTQCESCRDAVTADQFMKALAAEKIAEPVLPDPALIWLTTQLFQQSRTLYGIAQSTTLWHTAGFGVVALAWTLALTWKWEALEAIFSKGQPGSILLSLMNSSALSMPFVLTLVVLTCATIALAFHSVAFEE